MQTSLSPTVCRAFLGCQIEKAVDELNLTKKIISCLCLVTILPGCEINNFAGQSAKSACDNLVAMFDLVWSRNPSWLPRKGSLPDRRLMPLPAHSTSGDHLVVPCNAQFRCPCSPLDSAMGTAAGSACPGDCAPRGNGPRIAAGLGAAASPRTRSASTGILVSPISPSVPHRRSNSDSGLVAPWSSP